MYLYICKCLAIYMYYRLLVYIHTNEICLLLLKLNTYYSKVNYADTFKEETSFKFCEREN